MAAALLEATPSTVMCWIVSAVVLGLLFLASRGNGTRGKKLPPCYLGQLGIPWIGCIYETIKNPIRLIEDVRLKFGSIFTLKAIGCRLTFLTDTKDFAEFFKSSKIDNGALERIFSGIASLDLEKLKYHHKTINKTLRDRLTTPAHLEGFCRTLPELLSTRLTDQWGEKGSGDLASLVYRTSNSIMLDAIFGPGVLPTSDQEFCAKFTEEFETFDMGSAAGAELPGFILRQWTKSKNWMLKLMQDVPRKTALVQGDKTVLQCLLEAVEAVDSDRPKYTLLLALATLTSIGPTMFWTLAHVLDSKKFREQVQLEVDQMFEGKKSGEALTLAEVNGMVYLRQCVYETVRLYSTAILTHLVQEDFEINDFVIPKGDIVTLSPYWTHRNPDVFQEPQTFDPDRWSEVNLEKSQYPRGFIGFGGGRYMCPGRMLAVTATMLFVSLVLRQYDVQLLQPLPGIRPDRAVGVQAPSGSLNVTYTRSK